MTNINIGIIIKKPDTMISMFDVDGEKQQNIEFFTFGKICFPIQKVTFEGTKNSS